MLSFWKAINGKEYSSFYETFTGQNSFPPTNVYPVTYIISSTSFQTACSNTTSSQIYTVLWKYAPIYPAPRGLKIHLHRWCSNFSHRRPTLVTTGGDRYQWWPTGYRALASTIPIGTNGRLGCRTNAYLCFVAHVFQIAVLWCVLSTRTCGL